MALTLEELLKEVSVHPDKLNESISDDHLREIAILLTSWRTVATYLELSESDLDDVEREEKDEQMKKLKALQKWKGKIGFKATYRKLVEVLLSLAMADVAEKICLLLKAKPPKITSQPTSQKDAIPGKAVALSVQATGTEPLGYQWQWKSFGKKGEMDGWQNLSGEGSTFQVREVQACNAGYYWCVVSNSAGSETSQCASLTVVPEVCDLDCELHEVIDWIPLGLYLGIELPELMMIEANYPNDLKRCRVGMFEVWQNNEIPTWSAVVQALVGIGMRRLASELAQKHGTPLPKLPDSDPLDQLENIPKREAKPPKITSQPTSQKDALPEKAVAFSVQATGTEPLGYQWQWKPFGKKDEEDGWQNLSGEGSIFQVRSVKASNAGYYRCVVSNSAGSETSQCASLTVVPEVCDLDCELHEVIDWIPLGLHLGIKLPELEIIEANHPNDLKRRRIEMFKEWQKRMIPTWSAVVQALVEIGMRHLACELAQKHGTPLPKLPDIDLFDQLENIPKREAKPPKITSHPTSQKDAIPGKAVAFSVQATDTVPLGYQWQWKSFGKKGEKDGWQNLSGGSSTFQVRSVKASNAGYYRCVVYNSAGSDTSQCASLTVVPEIHDLESELHDVVDWIPFGLFLGIKLPQLKTIEADYPTLQRRRVGMFEVWQNNEIPTWSAVVQALVEIGMRRLASELAQKHGTPLPKLPDSDPLDQLENIPKREAKPPKITSHPTSQKDAIPGKAVAFSVQATGTVPLGYQWQWKSFGKKGEKDGWQNLSGGSSTFQVRSVKASNAGYYRCVVSNSAGSDTSQCAGLTVVPEIHDLESELHDVVDWIPFGLYLGIKLPQLKTIKANYPTLQRRRVGMFEVWQKNVIPTWSAVVQALVGIGMRHLASELAQKHGVLSRDVIDVSEVDSTPLDFDDLSDVRSELIPVSAQWKSIGIALQLKPSILDGISTENSGDPPACLTSTVTEWLNRNYNVKRFGEPTWQALVEAVGDPTGGANMALARAIARSHKAVDHPAVQEVTSFPPHLPPQPHSGMSSISDVDAALAGLVAVHSRLLRQLEGHRVVVRADIETVIKEGKVTLLSGGGSGHEPAHTGYVGCGMLSGAVAGAVFAPPPPESILAALRAVKSPRGTLMIVKNYANDVRNFSKALEQAVSEGMDVKMVIVGEDCVLPSTGKADERRGLCGTILVHKIAGALAERGDSLEEVTSAAEEVANSMVTMGARRSPNSVPGHKPKYIIGEGIHEKAGTELWDADTVVERMLTLMTSQQPGYWHLNIVPGMKVVLVVNNLGGTSNIHLSTMADAAIKHLEEKTQVRVTRKYMASLMTSLKRDGFSLTLLKASPFWEKCLDFPTTAPDWPNVSFGLHDDKVKVDSAPIPYQSSQTRSESEVSGGPTISTGLIRGVEVVEMTEFTVPTHGINFEWNEYGLKLSVSEGSLPVGVEKCKINIRASLSGQFQLPEDSHLLSPVFWILASCKFTKPVTLEIQHCALREDESVLSDLSFVSTKCSQKDLPYRFKQLDGGVFTIHSSHGSIQLDHFSGIGIAGSNKIPRSYCAHLYHTMKQIYDWRYYLAITRDLEAHFTIVKNHYSHFTKDLSTKFEFEGSEITLNIPEDGKLTEEGWNITPITPTVIAKREADEFKKGQLIPKCELMMEWEKKDDTPVRLKYKIVLNGASAPKNFLLLVLDPAEADPPRITTHPREIKDAVPGNQVAFTIQATGTEPLNYQWEHKTGDGNEVERIPGANRSTLTIPKVKKSDKGSYHCIVSNCAGSETSKFATLTVDGGWWRLLKTIVGILIVGIFIIALLALVFLWVSRNGDHPHDTTQLTLPYSSKPPGLTSNSGYPRWIAETSVMVFNQSQILNWAGYGLKLHIPQGILPAGLKECKLLIKVGLSGKFEFPQKTSLVSAIYLIDSEPRCKFSQPLTLEMQHCAQSSQTSRLNFARCSRNSPPYTFEILEGGEFSSQSAYGRIQLQSFSLITQLLSMLPWWARIFGDENVKYRARLYYLMKRVDRREIHFLITKDLDTYATKIQQKYRGATVGPNLSVEFDSGNNITLEPSSKEDGWRIDPLFPPVIMKEDVDSCGTRNEFPHCELSAEWTRPDELPSHLKREVILEGAKKPYDRFLIVIDTPLPGDHPHDTTQPTLPYSSKPPGLTSNSVVCHSISKTQELEKVVAEIGDWESLCENLEVPKPVMMRLRFSNKQDGRKKRECLQAYIDTGEACWEEVVKVVANNPFYNKRLAYEIASKYKDEL